jgi:hypothetical protein
MLLGAFIVTAVLTSGEGFSGSTWLRLMGQTFGWGAFFFPLLLLGIGLLLVWRNMPNVLDLEG